MLQVFLHLPTLRVLLNQTNNNGSILEFEYPDCEKDFQEIMRDIHWNAERNILAIQKVKSLNGLFGLRCYSFNTDILQDEIMQLWNARTLYNNIAIWWKCH